MKRILLLLAIINAAYGSKAQGRYEQFRNVRLGFNIDPMISVLKPQESGVSRTGAKAGLGFGLMADFNLSPNGNYVLASGFNVILGGSKLKYDAGKGLSDYKQNPAEYNFKLTYVQVPIALKLKTNSYDGMSFWGQFGTFVAFPVSARTDVMSVGQSYDRVNILPDVNRVNIGMLLGGGIEYPLGQTLRGTAGILYQNGFVDVTRNAKWDDGRVNLNSFALRLGLYF
ncbi:porin family protein [Chitinophaga vietnamensis]|uniref:porin family protein n=1 Tax=Chitinophaga vietnamensis TaxID=2593957 RepID=UPI001178044F|nr:porin family protein [Chitinophaga vietnamensis]